MNAIPIDKRAADEVISLEKADKKVGEQREKAGYFLYLRRLQGQRKR